MRPAPRAESKLENEPLPPGSVVGAVEQRIERIRAAAAKKEKEQQPTEMRDAETLIAAAALLRQLSDDAERRRKGFRKRQNPGEPEKLAFVLQLGRGWTFLVGRTPAKESTGPFAEFVGAAWHDWTGEISDKLDFFTQAIRVAGPVVKQERWQLTTRGPTWS